MLLGGFFKFNIFRQALKPPIDFRDTKFIAWKNYALLEYANIESGTEMLLNCRANG